MSRLLKSLGILTVFLVSSIGCKSQGYGSNLQDGGIVLPEGRVLLVRKVQGLYQAELCPMFKVVRTAADCTPSTVIFKLNREQLAKSMFGAIGIARYPYDEATAAKVKSLSIPSLPSAERIALEKQKAELESHLSQIVAFANSYKEQNFSSAEVDAEISSAKTKIASIKERLDGNDTYQKALLALEQDIDKIIVDLFESTTMHPAIIYEKNKGQSLAFNTLITMGSKKESTVETSREYQIPDDSRQVNGAVIPLPIEGGYPVKGLSLELKVAHEYLSDVRVVLIAPNGLEFPIDRLPDRNVTIDRDSFASMQNYAKIEGTTAGGTWKLVVWDVENGSSGSVLWAKFTVYHQPKQ